MVNEIIDGKYEIISKIGSGGTSIVYKAKRLADNRVVAIKAIRDELENIRELERHFRLEAEALNKMSHRNIRPRNNLPAQELLCFVQNITIGYFSVGCDQRNMFSLQTL